MNKLSTKHSILLVDDTEALLTELRNALLDELKDDDVQVDVWMPKSTDGDFKAVFDSHINDTTRLVITDYDLTSQQTTGLFGPSIVAWCQKRALPVGDFSRQTPDALPKEPNLFEFRVPHVAGASAPFIASVFRGFRDLRAAVEADASILKADESAPGALSKVLGRPRLESQFSLYMARLGSANSALFERKAHQEKPDPDARKNLLVYVLGHVLFNSVLRFPGPILSEQGLCAYLAISHADFGRVGDMFETARYAGPFADQGPFFWRAEVDEVLDAIAEGMPNVEAMTFDVLNRATVEFKVGQALARHDCDRCQGERGGYWCPFVKRPVCQREDCSVAATSWVPQGAELARVEKDFHDEWAPLLGL